VTILLPDKDDVDFNDPMIYVQTSLEAGTDTLEAITRRQPGANGASRSRRARSRRPAQPPRANGAAPFQVFRYQNPGKPEASVRDDRLRLRDPAQWRALLSHRRRHAATKAAIDKSSDDFLAVLNGTSCSARTRRQQSSERTGRRSDLVSQFALRLVEVAHRPRANGGRAHRRSPRALRASST